MNTRRRPLTIVVLALALASACGGKAPATSDGPLAILVTNDDGIDAPGIAALAAALRSLGTVTVAAPASDRTGASHGVTSDRPIAVRRTERQGQTWYAVDALPATCVRLAVEKLLPGRPDLVVSGINKGENLGTVTFYSATVGAAREAAFLGIPAIAVNLVSGDGADFAEAAAVLVGIVEALGRDGMAPATLLNVNIPALPRESLRGVRVTRQDTRAPVDLFERSDRPDGAVVFEPGWIHLGPDGEGTDIWAVRKGYVSVSVFGFDQSAAAPPAARLALERRLASLR